MKHTGLRLLAASSILAGSIAVAATRPHYGGSMHVALREAPLSLNPTQPGWADHENLFRLLFDTLVVLDDQGRPRPSLATSWQAEFGDQRWVFALRRNVMFSDGTPLTAEGVAASLRGSNPTWKVFPATDSVMIELSAPTPDLPVELALAHNSIVKQTGDKFLGTGPFVTSHWEAGKSLVMTAREDYWNGRPFLDSLEIDLGRNFHDQMVSLDLGKAQFIEIPSEQARHAATEGRNIESSSPVELIALVFNTEAQTPNDRKLRDALSLSIDRKSLNAVVAQNGGELSASLLPNWMTGYGFLFSSDTNLTRAQQERGEVPQAGLWSLGFNANDPILRLMAERVVLSARDAGLRMQLVNGSSGDVRLVRVTVISLDPQVALVDLATRLGLPAPAVGKGTIEDLYAAESLLLQSRRVIPLLHLRDAYAVSSKVKGQAVSRDGSWRMCDIWLTENP